MMRCFQLRLKPTGPQVKYFEHILDDCRETYNAALQERREAWKIARKRITLYEQYHELALLRKDPEFRTVAGHIQRDAIRRVDCTFKLYFLRRQRGEKAGYPRFKSPSQYNSFAWSDPRELLQSSILIPTYGHVKFKTHRRWAGKPKQIRIKRKGNKWIAYVICDIGAAPEKCSTISNPVGIDVGIAAFVTLSDGKKIDNPKFLKKHEAKLRAAKRNIDRARRGSKNQLRAKEIARRAYQRMADARKNYCHHVSKFLVGKYDLIAYENLEIRRMIKSSFGKSIGDASWGALAYQVTYKAEKAGRHAVAVNPKNTSQMCSGCGEIVPKKIWERTHTCPCGNSIDRDHNAALNILALGRSAVSAIEGISLTALRQN